MSILCIYREAPKFQASEQHPAAARYQVGAYFVDATGQAPTLAEVEALLFPTQDQRAAAVVDAQDRLQFEHLFNLENRMRALEAQPAMTRPQYRQALIDRWKQLNP